MGNIPAKRRAGRFAPVASILLCLLALGGCPAPGVGGDPDAGPDLPPCGACGGPWPDGGPGDAGPSDGGHPGFSRYLVGQNAWMDQDYGGALYKLWPKVQQSGVKLVRIGGNAYNTTPPSDAQYLAWVDAIRAIGAEPLVQVSSNSSSTQAAALVRHLNKTMNRGVRFWSIGNEPDLHSLGAAAVASYVKSAAPAMKEVDASIQIFAPETAWYNDAMIAALLGGSADISGKDVNGRTYIDVVSFHRYPMGGAAYVRSDVTSAASGIRASVNTLLGRIDAANAAQGRTGPAALRWAITEFNVTYRNWGSNAVDGVGTHSFLNGQFFAEVFSIGIEKNALSVMPWSIHESSGARSALDLGYLDNNVSYVPRSSFHHLRLVSEYLTGRWAPWTSNLPLVKVVATTSESQIAVMILNEHQLEDYDFTLRLAAGAVSGNRPLKLTVDAGVAIEYLDHIAAQSTVVLVFSPAGALTTKVRYGLGEHALLCLPPMVEGADAGTAATDAGCVP